MKKIMLKLASALLAVIMLEACSFQKSGRLEQYSDNSAGYGIEAFINSAADVAVTATDWEMQILQLMEKKLENQYLELYLGDYYDIAVLDKQTGKVFFSGEALYPEDGSVVSEHTKQLAASQLSVEYYNETSNPYIKTSYPECFLDPNIQQVSVVQVGDSLQVKYTIGQKSDNYFFAPAVRSETFEEMKAKSDELIQAGTLRKADYKNFLASYRIVSTSVLSASERKEYIEKYPGLEELEKIYVLKPTISDNQKKNVAATFLAFAFTDEMIQQEADAIGSYNIFASEADYFEIPLIYSLQGRDLIVTIDTPNIVSKDGLHLTRIHLLNTFGASSNLEAGYLFLPDGSGTIIDNATSVYGLSQLDIAFYGHDFGTTYKSFNTLEALAAFPVFGIKQDEAAVFGIVEENDAMAGAIGRVSVSSLSYNCAYPYFNYYTRDYLNQTNNIFTFSKVKPTSPYVVRYHFLYGEDANYSGMARYYRKYLEEISILKQANPSEDWKLDVRLFGSINKNVRTLGVPNKQVVATTTFKDAQVILDRLYGEGIRNLDIVYSEIMNGSREYKAPGKVDIHHQLGGLDGYNELMDHSKRLGYPIFTFADFGTIYKKGNGITGKNDVIHRLNGDTAVIYEGITVPEGLLVPSFVNPERYDSLIGRFQQEYRKVNGKQVYLPTLGCYLSGNYNDDAELTREESQYLTMKALQTLSESGLKLKLDIGNVYILSYADSLVNVATDSSASRLEQYPVPFMGMVLKGYLDFSGSPINNSGDYERAILKTIENGAGIYCEIMAADPFILSNTTYTNMYSVSSDVWLDKIMEKYHEVNRELQGLSSQRIYEHKRLVDEVFQTTYEDGTSVVVNYSDEVFYVGETKVKSLDYAVIRP